MDLYCGCQKPRVFRPRGDVHTSVHFDCDGDVLVVDRSLEPGAGMIVVATVRGDFTCKRLED
ncbi:DNA polymerase V subunit UmuD [compost metagenome]